MDDQRMLRDQLAELMIEHQAARLATGRAAASMTITPSSAARAAWKAALAKEEQIAARRRQVLDKLLNMLD
jgi:hypothetical protein